MRQQFETGFSFCCRLVIDQWPLTSGQGEEVIYLWRAAVNFQRTVQRTRFTIWQRDRQEMFHQSDSRGQCHHLHHQLTDEWMITGQTWTAVHRRSGDLLLSSWLPLVTEDFWTLDWSSSSLSLSTGTEKQKLSLILMTCLQWNLETKTHLQRWRRWGVAPPEEREECRLWTGSCCTRRSWRRRCWALLLLLLFLLLPPDQKTE